MVRRLVKFWGTAESWLHLIYLNREMAVKTRKTCVNRKLLTHPALKRQQRNGETKKESRERPRGNRHTQVYPGLIYVE